MALILLRLFLKCALRPQNPQEIPQDFVLVFDYTSIKLTNRGEWLSKKYGNKKSKGWIKLHVVLDISSGKVVAMKVTDKRTHDSECAIGLIEKLVIGLGMRWWGR